MSPGGKGKDKQKSSAKLAFVCLSLSHLTVIHWTKGWVIDTGQLYTKIVIDLKYVFVQLGHIIIICVYFPKDLSRVIISIFKRTLKIAYIGYHKRNILILIWFMCLQVTILSASWIILLLKKSFVQKSPKESHFRGSEKIESLGIILKDSNTVY